MKTIAILIFALSCIILCPAYSQDMSEQDSIATQSMIGTWQESFIIDNIFYELENEYSSDMSFISKARLVYATGETKNVNLSGKWIVMASDLICEVVYTTDPEHFPVGLVSSSSILNISDSVIIYRLDNGLGVVSRNIAYINRVW